MRMLHQIPQHSRLESLLPKADSRASRSRQSRQSSAASHPLLNLPRTAQSRLKRMPTG